MRRVWTTTILTVIAGFSFSNCGNVDPRVGDFSYIEQILEPVSYTTGSPYIQQYSGNSGTRVKLVNGRAIAPANAPMAVKRAVAAGNALQGKPYKMGGGHAEWTDSGYDCSGSVSYVLRNAGLLGSTMPSGSFRSYGERGKGKWITVYARGGHVFMTVGGLRLDARGTSRGAKGGPRWLAEPRSGRGFSLRHPAGL